ncbi:UDP-glucose 4-epimerase GalE [Miniimonas arenae]|uniref:UDP-glucose 4-epimerase n=1 Tax=Miniimonas arenae TaxID=676201 RepID=A0A5C5B7U1_9MICO|nr:MULTISPECIES: UDP-glucose 4-epimerase GalE [Miniimonas]TNU72970.1 UDP-glucose 4-epimerase GalE [Miniimonas arenae]
MTTPRRPSAAPDTVLVTGGAGYIGSHVAHTLTAAGRGVVVLDDLSLGRPERVRGLTLLRLDLTDPGTPARLAAALREHRVGSVIHLAGHKRVAESVVRPLQYAEQNVTGLLRLLRALADGEVRTVVFSSSAAVYGDVTAGRVTEGHPPRPVNPYGRSKLAGEWLLADFARATGSRTIALRYFNVAGTQDGVLADRSTENLVSATVAALRAGRSPVVNGTDYPTADGTCVRDFVHVQDLAEAHVRALDALWAGADVPPALNLGTGVGTSVRDVVARLCELAGRPGAWAEAGRRSGDPAAVVADVTLARDTLGWTASRGPTEILQSAWLHRPDADLGGGAETRQRDRA